MPDFPKLFESRQASVIGNLIHSAKWKGIWWIKFEDSRPIKMSARPNSPQYRGHSCSQNRHS
jgi:hypothetical protein